MTISRNDLAIFKPEQLGSSDQAGGQRTKNAVVSGKINDLFSPITDLDHARSALDIVKCFPTVNTANTTPLLGAHIFISERPADPLVNYLIAESSELDDADRMTDIVDILESSVRAGQLIRNRLVGMLAGQDSFPRAYLQSSYQFNGREYWSNVTLQQGQVVVISVEYQGNEDANWPRFEHFCEIQETVTGGQSGAVRFSPPIPYDTPNHDVYINGESGCTKLRYVSANKGVKFHGVTKLTAGATTASNELEVENTSVELLPKVRTTATKGGNTLPGVEDSQGSINGVNELPSANYTNVYVPAVDGQSSYIFELSDLLQDPWFAENGVINLDYNGSYKQYAKLSVTGTTVTVIFTEQAPYGNQSVGLNYYSSNRYNVYDSQNAFPADHIITKNGVFGVITFADSNYGTSDITMKPYWTGDVTSVPLVESNGNQIATINATTGVITKEPDFRGDFSVAWGALLIETDPGASIPPGDLEVTFLLDSDDPIVESFYVVVSTTSETLLSGSADAAGAITGTGVTGNIVNGVVTLNFSQRVLLSTLTYDISEIVTLSPPPELYGLNPLRIKNGGVVDVFNAWSEVKLHHAQHQAVTGPAAGQTKAIRAGAYYVDIIDANGASLWTVTDDHFTVDKDAGTVTLNSDFTGFTAPFVLTDIIGELAQVVEVKQNKLVLAAPPSVDYPLGANVSGVQDLGDLEARVGPVRDMTSWENNWDQDGSDATASVNVVDYPIQVFNNSAVNEDWVLIFYSQTDFRCVGRRMGQIATGNTQTEFAPVNPHTLMPYLVIPAGALGDGWNIGEAVRFETFASSKPALLLRPVQSGHSQINSGRPVLAFRGNKS